MLEAVIKAVMSHRDSRLAKKIAAWCHYTLMTYENVNYDFHANGEATILQKLSAHNFGAVFFDVGANTGEYTRMLWRNFPRAAIYAFEITATTFGRLQEAVGNLSTVILSDVGLSNRQGETRIKDYGERSGLNSMYDFPHPLEYEWITAKTMTGDQFCDEKMVDEIDFLKIDVEGAEHLVLEGFASRLRSGKIKVIQFEYGYVNILSKFLLLDYYQLFQKHGYRVGKIYPRKVEFKEYRLSDENFWGPNYLAVRADEKDLIALLST